MNAKKKNALLEKLNAYIAPHRAEMRDGKVSIRNTRPGRTDGVTEWFQTSLQELAIDAVNQFDYRNDEGDGIWFVGEGFRAGRTNDLGNMSDPYSSTTREVLAHLNR